MAKAPIRVWTFLISQPARALSWACAHEGTKVEEISIVPGRDTNIDSYRSQHPLTTVPRMDDNGLVLNESHAIMCYLGDKFNWKLYPKDPVVRAKIHEYMNWHHQNTRRISLALFSTVMRPDLKDLQTTAAVWKKDLIRPAGVLATIERLLTKSPWICGDQPTVADLSCYCEVGQCLDKYCGLFTLHGIDLAEYPCMAKWLEKCETLEGYDAAHAMLKKRSPMIREKAKEHFGAYWPKL